MAVKQENRQGVLPRGMGIKGRIWFWLGIAVMAFTALPNLILGEQSIFTWHDQLDGEVIAYILQARHLFSGNMLPEFMGGMPKTALTLPAPVCVLLFLGGDYFAALLVMQLAGRLAGFAGMYLLSREAKCPSWVAAAAGMLYGLLPFLPVYGLSQYGIPMLFWCVLQLRKKKHLVSSYCYAALFGLASSLVLVGFGVLGMGAVLLLWDFLRKKEPWHLLAAWQLLLGVYIAENFRLLLQLAGMDGGIDFHKAEYALGVQPFWGNFLQNLLRGGQHSEGYQELLVPAALVLTAGGLILFYAAGKSRGKSSEEGSSREGLPQERILEEKVSREGLPREELSWEASSQEGSKAWKCMGICLGWNFFFALAAALWDSGAGVSLRGSMGALRAFQLDRLLWIAPCFWYLFAACGCTVLLSLRKCGRGVFRLVMNGCLALLIVTAGVTGMRILLAGDIKSNLGKLRNPDYGILSFSDYYAMGVMEQVEDFLTDHCGKSQEEYRVVSLGIDPAAALYHGFYCLDGYSNHYPLSYKHAFRKIISRELEKSEYLRAYFDGWGNRCYVFSAECPGYFTIKKGGFFFQDCRLDAEALREMGCSYLLSAAYIQNAQEQGLMLLNDVPFETEDSYYCIYVYEIL